MKTTNTHYIEKGVKYDRLTSVLGIMSSGIDWMKEYRAELLEERAEKGILLHETARQYARKKLTPAKVAGLKARDEEVYDMFWTFKEWFDNTIKRVLYAERTFLVDKLKVGTRIDLYAETHEGRRILVDLKTTANLYPTHIMQVATQYNLIHSDDGKTIKYPIDDLFVINVRNKLKVHKLTSKQISLGYNLFLNALSLHRGINNLL